MSNSLATRAESQSDSAGLTTTETTTPRPTTLATVTLAGRTVIKPRRTGRTWPLQPADVCLLAHWFRQRLEWQERHPGSNEVGRQFVIDLRHGRFTVDFSKAGSVEDFKANPFQAVVAWEPRT